MWNTVGFVVNNRSKSKKGSNFCNRPLMGSETEFIMIAPSVNIMYISWSNIHDGASQNIHSSKITLCIWRDQLGAVHYMLLSSWETIRRDLYPTQLTLPAKYWKANGCNAARETKNWLEVWQCSPPHFENDQFILGSTELQLIPGPPYSPEVAISNTSPLPSMAHDRYYGTAFPIFWESQELHQFVDLYWKMVSFSTQDLYPAGEKGVVESRN